MKTTTQAVLDTDSIETLSLGLKPIDPPAPVKTALRDRLLKRVATATAAPPGTQHLTVAYDENGWVEVMPLIKKKVLFESEHGRGVLFRFQPGARLPAHEHNTDEECVVLEGELMIAGETTVHAGDFHLARKDIPHGELTSATGALFYIRTGANFKFRPIHA
jgi:quercetin dioxygenase-like cupin family protein